MASIELTPRREIAPKVIETFTKQPGAHLFTPDVAIQISSALLMPEVDVTFGAKDTVFSITARTGNVGIHLISPHPEFQGTRPERMIIVADYQDEKFGLLFFNPTEINTNQAMGRITVSKDLGHYTTGFVFDSIGRYAQYQGSKTPSPLAA